MKVLFEIRRKAIHIILGMAFCFLIYFDLFFPLFWLAILIFSVFFSFLLKKHRNSLSAPAPKILDYGKEISAGKKFCWWETWLLSFIFSFEREEEMRKFPLQGAIAFLLGCILSFIFFPKLIAISAIIVLFVGDSAACFYGIYFGKIKIPWSPKKHLDAALIGAFVSAIFIFFLLNIEKSAFPFWKIFLASALALVFESLKFGKKNISIDDNVLIPLIAGFILYLMQ